RSLYQSMRNLTGQALRLLSWRRPRLGERLRAEADLVLGARASLLQRFGRLLRSRLTALRLRCHGDYRLAQVLWTGEDVVLIDWEGSPSRPLDERRLKGSPLLDVAGMQRSLHACAYAALSARAEEGEGGALEGWARLWCAWASAAFLRGYLQ